LCVFLVSLYFCVSLHMCLSLPVVCVCVSLSVFVCLFSVSLFLCVSPYVSLSQCVFLLSGWGCFPPLQEKKSCPICSLRMTGAIDTIAFLGKVVSAKQIRQIGQAFFS